MIANNPATRQLVLNRNRLSIEDWVIDRALMRAGNYLSQLNLDIALTTDPIGWIRATGAYSAQRTQHLIFVEDPFLDDPEDTIARSSPGTMLQQSGYTIAPIYVYCRPLRKLANEEETRVDQLARVVLHELFHTVTAAITHDNRRHNIMHEDLRLGGWQIDPLLVRILTQFIGRR